MIREFSIQDVDGIIGILKDGYIFDEEDVRGELTKDKRKFLVYDNNGIKAFMYAEMPSDETRECFLKLYVAPEHRRKGIGTELYNDMDKYLKELKTNILGIRFRVDWDDATEFFRKLGYKKWFGLHNMLYKGGAQPDPNMKFVKYEDKYFEEYAKAICDCFYEMRKENDIRPYAGFAPSEENRKRNLEDGDSIYIYFEDGKLAASAYVKGGYIDDLFVIPEYQGRGLGKRAVQFAINKALENGAQRIELGAVEWNIKAISLYKSLGFEIIQTNHTYRQFSEK